MSIIKTLLKQVVKRPFTNPFPTKYAPDKISKVKKTNPPIELPEDFRGKIKYDRKKCIGCRLCVTVCPANAMEYLEKDKKIKHHVLRCTMCGLCAEVCPTHALSQSKEFLLAETNKNSKNLIEK